MVHPLMINYSSMPKMVSAIFQSVRGPLLGLFLLIILAVAVKLTLHALETKRLAQSGIHDIDQMSGRTFEKYLAVVFHTHGYRVQLTRASKDQGADLVLIKGADRTVVQAKRWKKHVGNSAVQEIVAAKGFYKAQHTMVVTNSFFTNAAKQLAQANNVVLWDRTQLISELIKADVKKQITLTSSLSEVDSTCPICGQPLVKRTKRTTKSTFWGCSAYPTCHYTKPMEGIK